MARVRHDCSVFLRNVSALYRKSATAHIADSYLANLETSRHVGSVCLRHIRLQRRHPDLVLANLRTKVRISDAVLAGFRLKKPTVHNIEVQQQGVCIKPLACFSRIAHCKQCTWHTSPWDQTNQHQRMSPQPALAPRLQCLECRAGIVPRLIALPSHVYTLESNAEPLKGQAHM